LGDFIKGLEEDSKESLQQQCESLLNMLKDVETEESVAKTNFQGFRSLLSVSFYDVDLKLKSALQERYVFPSLHGE
jgi:hypothetical protein